MDFSAISNGKGEASTLIKSKRQTQVCNVCGKSSVSSIFPICVDRIRAEAIARKKREDKGEE
jgi:recombinational DNA repair protein RecR